MVLDFVLAAQGGLPAALTYSGGLQKDMLLLPKRLRLRAGKAVPPPRLICPA